MFIYCNELILFVTKIFTDNCTLAGKLVANEGRGRFVTKGFSVRLAQVLEDEIRYVGRTTKRGRR